MYTVVSNGIKNNRVSCEVNLDAGSMFSERGGVATLLVTSGKSSYEPPSYPAVNDIEALMSFLVVIK